jgi:hypothetical protein
MANRFPQIIQRIDQRPVEIPQNHFFHTSKLHLFAHTAKTAPISALPYRTFGP